MGLLFEKPLDRPLTLYQGATFRLADALQESDTLTVLNLTGCSAVAEIWENFEGTAPLVRWNTDAGDTTITDGATLTLGGSAGTVVLELSDEATAELPRLTKSAYWYFALTWPDGDTTWLYSGMVKIAQKKERAP